MALKVRFKLVTEDDGSHYQVLFRRKDTGKWVVYGTCHISARESVKAGDYSLIQPSPEFRSPS